MAMVRMTRKDYFQMTLVGFYLQRMRVAVVGVDQTFAETAAAVKTRRKMIEIAVVMVDLSVEYVVVAQAARVVQIVAVEDWVIDVAVVDIGASEHHRVAEA